ncbi:MAG TPA: thioredoxin domain-containing protein [Verrucomicrobiota bacterium]|nr:thioredoxin domain-containing protein [Verrucomicrobiota bacterium]
MNLTPPGGPPAEIREGDFEKEVLKSAVPVLVAFVAPWSQACRVLDSVLTDVAAACAGRVKVLKLNADDSPDLSLWYEIASIPALLYFVNGLPRARVIGTASKDAILAKIEGAAPDRHSSSSVPKS